MAYFGSSVVKGYDGPKYTQSDVDTQKGDIANSQNTYNQYKQQADDAKNVYDDKFNSQTSYGDLIKQGEAEYGVNEARNQYQQSKDAVNATINAMNTLPSSINANSNVVLTNSQRQAALGNQMAKYQNTLTDLSNQASSDLERYNQAVSQAQNFAGQSMSQEQYNINTALSRYQTEISNAQQQYQNLLNEKNYLNTMYGTMFDQYYKEEMMKLEEWADNLSAETQRYVADQNKKASDYAANIQKYLADTQAKASADQLAAQKAYQDQLAKAGNQDQINKIYSDYMSTLQDYDSQNSPLGYLFGGNSLFGTAFGTQQTANMKANSLRNKGFEDYLYNQSPTLQAYFRESMNDADRAKYGVYGG